MSQGEQDSVFNIPLDGVVSGEIIPIKLVFVKIWQENGASMLFKNWDRVFVSLRLFPCLCSNFIVVNVWMIFEWRCCCWHRVSTCRAVRSCIFGSEPSWLLRFLNWRRGQLSYHFLNRCNHQIRISLWKINVLLQHEPILIKSVRGFHPSDVNGAFCWRSRSARWINWVINHEGTCITLRITICRNYLCICSLCCLLKKFLSNHNEFKGVHILTFNC